jgi:hypothetical protein
VVEPTKQSAGERRAREKVKPVPKITRETNSTGERRLLAGDHGSTGKIVNADEPGSTCLATFE